MYANIVQITEIGRFEKSDQKNKKTKRDFQTSELRSLSKKRFLNFGFSLTKQKRLRFENLAAQRKS